MVIILYLVHGVLFLRVLWALVLAVHWQQENIGFVMFTMNSGAVYYYLGHF